MGGVLFIDEAYALNGGSENDFRGVRNSFKKILVQQANRLAAQENVSRENFMVITAEDVRAARDAEKETSFGMKSRLSNSSPD